MSAAFDELRKRRDAWRREVALTLDEVLEVNGAFRDDDDPRPVDVVALRRSLAALAWLHPVAQHSVEVDGWPPEVLAWFDAYGVGCADQLNKGVQ